MLEWLKTNATAARDKLSAEVSKFKNREFMEAVVSGCALVAAADGTISSDEKQKMVGFIQNSNELKAFDVKDVIKSFNAVCEKFEFDQQIGRAEALKSIGQLRKKKMPPVCWCACAAPSAVQTATSMKVSGLLAAPSAMSWG